MLLLDLLEWLYQSLNNHALGFNIMTLKLNNLCSLLALLKQTFYLFFFSFFDELVFCPIFHYCDLFIGSFVAVFSLS